ncbi:MAG: nucleotidyltransferase family protein [Candidatus Symbiothrix sp.]|jgi:predicted nucleotidyltransferase|nr:nucleotidyltransferase family protein [Candidatus Symbiothrix sp.]
MQQLFAEKLRNFFPAYPVEKAWVFGSYARGEETRKSDIDIMVRFDKDAHISLFDYAGIMNDLENLFHRKIDLVTEGGIMKFAKDSIEHDKILVYERNDTR